MPSAKACLQRPHDRPGALDLVVADEQRRVADHRVEQQTVVGVDGLAREALLVGEVHRDVAHRERRARDLGAEREADPLVGLDPQRERVPPQVAGELAGERQVRRALEDHPHLGQAMAEPLAGAHEDRHARPAPVVDVDADRDVRLHLGMRVDTRFGAIGGDRFAVDRAGAVLAADDLRGGLFLVEDDDRSEQLHLLVPDDVALGRARAAPSA